MCILILKPKGVKLPDYTTLMRCAQHNPHGYGYATPDGYMFKTLDRNSFIQSLYEADENLPMLIHFRYATHGSKKCSNCHPFRDDANGLIFAHNGVLNIQTLKDKTDSETAFKLLFSPSSDRYGYGSKQFINAVESIRGDSRFGFMNDDGDIIAFGRFYDDSGNIAKNGVFRPKGKLYFSNAGFMM